MSIETAVWLIGMLTIWLVGIRWYRKDVYKYDDGDAAAGLFLIGLFWPAVLFLGALGLVMAGAIYLIEKSFRITIGGGK